MAEFSTLFGALLASGTIAIQPVSQSPMQVAQAQTQQTQAVQTLPAKQMPDARRNPPPIEDRAEQLIYVPRTRNIRPVEKKSEITK